MASGPKLDGAGLAKMATLDEATGAVQRLHGIVERMAIAVLRLLQREAPAFFSDFEVYQAEDRREAARIVYHKV